jgi:hypothetical protein
MLLHAMMHWPGGTHLNLWPFSLDYAVFFHNNIPSKLTKLTLTELFTHQKVSSALQQMCIWGCPMSVLDPTLLQDGKNLPKWHPCK